MSGAWGFEGLRAADVPPGISACDWGHSHRPGLGSRHQYVSLRATGFMSPTFLKDNRAALGPALGHLPDRPGDPIKTRPNCASIDQGLACYQSTVYGDQQTQTVPPDSERAAGIIIWSMVTSKHKLCRLIAKGQQYRYSDAHSGTVARLRHFDIRQRGHPAAKTDLVTGVSSPLTCTRVASSDSGPGVGKARFRYVVGSESLKVLSDASLTRDVTECYSCTIAADCGCGLFSRLIAWGLSSLQPSPCEQRPGGARCQLGGRVVEWLLASSSRLSPRITDRFIKSCEV
ncbi:hypothetical protein RRG08_014352 [Elysia crispata]|uniref:Uncharacterized protein n=1 Tax=Elysia crispata TaxID=231223 RepID=A0AAE1CJ95_9GAST|nr:hypothetical protein RRG08_014352 [Elysia crispata]